jgi:phosphoglycolate phosphatase
LAVFDCDGTLVDSQRSIVEAMQAAFGALDHPAPEADDVRRIVGLPLLDGVARLAPHADADDHARLSDGYKDAFAGLRRRGQVVEPLFPGAHEALAALEAAGWSLGVATGKGLRGLLNTLGGHGIVERFATLQTADQVPGKPNPDMLFRAMDETGAEAAQTVMIGDTTFDMEMAAAAGTRAVGVAWGYHPSAELEAAGAHIIVHDFNELNSAIESLVEAS